jgi:ABC-type transport system involved in multi-copper enzyme maturation permease subunit
MSAALWVRQALLIMQIELKRYILARRWFGLYVVGFAPVFLVAVAALNNNRNPLIGGLTVGYAVFYQTFELRLAIFFCCAMVFSHLFRGEVLEKTLHFYLLTPVRREVLILGKYLAGVAATVLIFGASTLLTHVLLYMQNRDWATFFLEGDGMTNTLRYVTVTALACMAYGAVFLLAGVLFKNPAFPVITLAAWEAFFFILPESMQKFTIMHYLQSMLPIGIDMGPFAVVVDRTPPIWGIPTLLVVAAVAVWTSGVVMRRAQITYSTD